MNIIQIGCYKGKDHVQTFITEHYDQVQNAILIDGNKGYVEECQNAYKDLPKVQILYYAIVLDDSTSTTFYISKDAPEECTTSKVYVDSSPLKDYVPTEVPAINLNNLFKLYKLTRIDRLYIDAEGMDIDIVNSIDFSTFDIPYLHFEHLHAEGARLTGTGEKFQNCINKLTDLGYQIQNIHWDIIATK